MFNDSFNTICLGGAALARPPNLSIVTDFSRNIFPPSESLSSGSSDATVCPSASVSLPLLTYLETMHDPEIKSVESTTMRKASNRRRRKRGEHLCPLPGCFGAPTKCLTIALNPDLGNASPAHRSNLLPSLNSASSDPTVCPNAIVSPPPLAYLETMCGPGVKPVGSTLMRVASNRRRKKPGVYPCPFPECSADFTAPHNRMCLYFFTDNIFHPG